MSVLCQGVQKTTFLQTLRRLKGLKNTALILLTTEASWVTHTNLDCKNKSKRGVEIVNIIAVQSGLFWHVLVRQRSKGPWKHTAIMSKSCVDVHCVQVGSYFLAFLTVFFFFCFLWNVLESSKIFIKIHKTLRPEKSQITVDIWAASGKRDTNDIRIVTWLKILRAGRWFFFFCWIFYTQIRIASL